MIKESLVLLHVLCKSMHGTMFVPETLFCTAICTHQTVSTTKSISFLIGK